MRYVKVDEDGKVAHYTIADLRLSLPNTSIPILPSEESLAEYGVFPVLETAQPVFDVVTQKIEEGIPMISDGKWTQVWSISPKTQEELDSQEQGRISSLWQAAHDYEYSHINGSAVGLITIGILQSKPKCLAVQEWVSSIWSLYYARKASNSTDTDFSIAGTCPYTIQELMAEVLG